MMESPSAYVKFSVENLCISWAGPDTGTPIQMPASESGSTTEAGGHRNPPMPKPRLPFLEGWNNFQLGAFLSQKRLVLSYFISIKYPLSFVQCQGPRAKSPEIINCSSHLKFVPRLTNLESWYKAFPGLAKNDFILARPFMLVSKVSRYRLDT